MSQTDKKKFPITEARYFATSNGLEKESLQIGSVVKNRSKGHRAPFKILRGYFIDLFLQNDLLDQFKEQYWPRGKEKGGDTECRSCLKIKSEFDKEMGGALLSFSSRKPSTKRIGPPPIEEALVTPVSTESPPVEDDPVKRTLIEDIDEIEHRDIGATTKSVLSNARIGQGPFRADVFSRWGNCCAVTGSTTHCAIKASHILPWRDSTDEERLDPHNGLPLIASLDSLFDTGLISFDSSGQMLVSPKLAESERKIFGLNKQALLKRPSEQMAKYLAGHRQKHGFGE